MNGVVELNGWMIEWWNIGGMELDGWMEFWSDGILEEWNWMDGWSFGVMEYWRNGIEWVNDGLAIFVYPYAAKAIFLFLIITPSAKAEGNRYAKRKE